MDATAQRTMEDRLHDRRGSSRLRPSYRGGEGVTKLVHARDNSFGGAYWIETLFAWHGRALPLVPMLVYLAYNVVVTALIVQVLHRYQQATILSGLSVPLRTIGLSLFLLMGFRANTAYERWWDGNMQWSKVQEGSRTIARTALGLIRQDTQTPLRLIRWTFAFVISCKETLREERVLRELTGILDEAEIHEIRQANHMPSFCMWKLGEMLGMLAAMNRYPDCTAPGMLDPTLRDMDKAFATCERIKSTPMPFAYIVHLRAFMFMYLLLLPYTFLTTLGWYNILVCAALGYALLGFEAIGTEIENPFGRDFNDLPLDQITDGIHTKLAAALQYYSDEADKAGTKVEQGGFMGDVAKAFSGR